MKKDKKGSMPFVLDMDFPILSTMKPQERIRILFVDDDVTYAPLTQEYLESNGFAVTLVHQSEQGLARFRDQSWDLCILDVRMPFKDGFTLAREIRAIDPEIPLIFLTGQTEKSERLTGWQLGADDYVTKPFSLEELVWRIQAILRRSRPPEPPVAAILEVGAFRFLPDLQLLEGPTGSRRLSGIESQLLDLFLRHPERSLDRETALRRIWSDEHLLHGRSLNVYISRLRGFFQEDPRIRILNIHGRGYRIIVED